MSIYSKCFQNLMNGKTYFAKVFTVNHKGRINNRIDLPVASVIPLAFPAEPTAYELIGTYTSSVTFTAPEDGWYQIELFGPSGAGGSGTYSTADTPIQISLGKFSATGGNGGGGGAYCCSNLIKLNKGDTVEIIIDMTCTVTIHSSTGEVYNVMTCETGTDATNNSVGIGGTASGGNFANINGEAGSTGLRASGGMGSSNTLTSATGTGGSGGVSGHSDGNKGGDGGTSHITYNNGSLASASKGTPGSALEGFCRIYRGNTNIPA